MIHLIFYLFRFWESFGANACVALGFIGLNGAQGGIVARGTSAGRAGGDTGGEAHQDQRYNQGDSPSHCRRLEDRPAHGSAISPGDRVIRPG